MISKQQDMLDAKEEFISMMAARQHEFNKHIQMIASLAERSSQDSLDMIRMYTGDLIERGSGVGKAVYVGDGLLSAYFAKRMKDAEEQGIELSVLVMAGVDKLPCSNTEAIEIIGNLLDNSFEAVEKMGKEDRKIFLEMYEEKESVIIQTMNRVSKSFPVGKAQAIRRGFSTKRGVQRGHGLANVQEIAAKYGGKVSFHANDEVISVKVLLHCAA